MRTASAQQTQTINRLETRNTNLDRQIALLSTQERAAKDALRSAEMRTKALKEEMVRLKGTVMQIRGQCATDIRRRDGEIKRLKKHLEGRRGREGNGGQFGIVVVTPGTSKSQDGSRYLENAVNLESPEYSLKQETTEFLTQLSQSLSDENDALIGLIRSTLATLRSLQGLPADPQDPQGQESAAAGQEGPPIIAPPSYEDLAASVDEVLEHLRGLLTNPSFVALEEVEVREDEIIRLRRGWEKMEARWKEAVDLMDGWRKRMIDTGDTINLEDLRLGLNLDPGISAPDQLKEESSGMEESAQGDDSHLSGLGEVLEEEDVEQPSSVDALDDPSSIIDDLDIAIVSPLKKKVLSPRSPNARLMFSPRKAPFPSIPEENTQELRNADTPFSIPFFSPIKAPSRSLKRAPQPSPQVSFFPPLDSPLHYFSTSRKEIKSNEICHAPYRQES